MDGARERPTACPICFRAPDGSIATTTTPCEHVFCTACIVEATARSVQGRSCPMCRTPFPAGYMDVPADELTSYLLKVRSRHAQSSETHTVRFNYGNTVLPLARREGGSRWCAFLQMEGSATARGRALTEVDYIDHCEFIVHHGPRDERVVVSEPPFELRRNSVSSAAHGENGSRRSASPMLGVMVELRVVWRTRCNLQPLALHLSINLQGATHSCSVDFHSAPAPHRAPRAQRVERLSTGGHSSAGSGSGAAAVVGEGDVPGPTTQLMGELETMQVERAKLVRQKVLLERASDDILRERHGIGIANGEQELRHLRGDAGSGRGGGAMAALGLLPGLGVGQARAVIDEAGRVAGPSRTDAGSSGGGGRSARSAAIGRRLGIGRQLQAAIDASEARDRVATRSGGCPGTGARSSRGRGGAGQGSRPSGRAIGGPRTRSAPAAAAPPAPEPEPAPAPVPKRRVDRARLSRLAQPAAVKQTQEHSAKELAELRHGYAKQGLPPSAYSEDIVAEHGLTLLGLGSGTLPGPEPGSGGE